VNNTTQVHHPATVHQFTIQTLTKLNVTQPPQQTTSLL